MSCKVDGFCSSTLKDMAKHWKYRRCNQKAGSEFEESRGAYWTQWKEQQKQGKSFTYLLTDLFLIYKNIPQSFKAVFLNFHYLLFKICWKQMFVTGQAGHEPSNIFSLLFFACNSKNIYTRAKTLWNYSLFQYMWRNLLSHSLLSLEAF